MKSLDSQCQISSILRTLIILPLPTSQTVDLIKLRKDWSGNETRKGAGHHVSSVEDGHARCNLLSVVEHGDHVQSARIKWSFCDSEQESAHQHGLVAIRLVRQERQDRPSHAEASHVPRRSHAVEDHVGGNLAAKIADEEDRDAGIVLSALEAQVVFEAVQSSVNHCIAIEEVEKVHEPENGLRMRVR